MTRTPLVYVLSNGRSGSTLLELLLDARTGVYSVGELQCLAGELARADARCGCGETHERCGFWRGALDAAGLDADDLNALARFRDAQGRGKVLRPGELPGVLWPRPNAYACLPQETLPPAQQHYAELHERLFEAVARAAEAERGEPLRYVVDASKDLYRLAWLAASSQRELRVIHLVRDPRAFVYSMWRPDQRAARAARFALRWNVENALAARFLRRALEPDQVRKVRYEDLAREPQTVLDGLCDWLDLPRGPYTEGFRRHGHALAGNAMRWRDDEVRLDERWRQELPERTARGVWTLTAPLGRRWGYARS